MEALKTVDGFLFIHDPEVDSVITWCGVEELAGHHVNGVDSVVEWVVEKFWVLVNLPEDALTIKWAWDDTIFRVVIKRKDVRVVTVVCIHVGHFSNIPHFHWSVIGHGVKLIILFVEADILHKHWDA